MHIFKHSLFRLKITVGCLTSTYPSIHVEDTFKITVGCLWSTYPSIHFSLDEDTLEITVDCPLCAYPSIRKNSQDHGRLPAVRISKHSPSHHVETLSRSRSVARRAHIQAFATKTCTRAGCGHVHPYCRLCLCLHRRSTAALV